MFTCSALKDAYRQTLIGSHTDVALVYLSGDFDTIYARVSRRQGHFMKADLVRSQFEALEPPRGALTLDVKLPPDEIVGRIVAAVR